MKIDSTLLVAGDTKPLLGRLLDVMMPWDLSGTGHGGGTRVGEGNQAVGLVPKGRVTGHPMPRIQKGAGLRGFIWASWEGMSTTVS